MEARDGRATTVLIADDDFWLRDVLGLLLEADGLQYIEAASGPETVQVAQEQLPDVILLDVGLPGKSGIGVLEDLRRDAATREIPVFLVSGQIDLVETGHAHDARAAFHKPLDFGAFVRKVHEITRGT